MTDNGEVGAVFALEASRLARNNRDWHHFLSRQSRANLTHDTSFGFGSYMQIKLRRVSLLGTLPLPVILTLVVIGITGCEKKAELASERGASEKQLAVRDDEAQHHIEQWTPENEVAVGELRSSLQSAASRGVYRAEENVPAKPFSARSTGNLLEIYIFNIGQADSLLAVGPNGKTMLVDLGEPMGGVKPDAFESGRKTVLKRIKEITGDTHIDYFVVSHYHQDHVGRNGPEASNWGSGIIGLLSDFSIKFSVGTFIHIGDDGQKYMKPENGRASYKAIKELMPMWKQYGRVLADATPQFGQGQILLGDGVQVDILSFAGKTPDGSSAFDKVVAAGGDYDNNPGNENDLSIALKLSAGEFEFLSAGDLNGTDDPDSHPWFVKRIFGEIYANVERHLVEYWQEAGIETDVETYRANHHGSKYSSTQLFTNALDPEFVIYSTGALYNHPEIPVIERCRSTARQFATTAVTNGTAFQSARGQTMGEIMIKVPETGQFYSINGEKHRTYSSQEEFSGNDVGEEDKHY